jgi:hypothetical protein
MAKVHLHYNILYLPNVLLNCYEMFLNHTTIIKELIPQQLCLMGKTWEHDGKRLLLYRQLAPAEQLALHFKQILSYQSLFASEIA